MGKIILLQNHRTVRQNEPIEVLEDDIVDIDDSKIEVDDQLFQDIFDLPQDVQVSNIDVPKPEVLVVENKSVEDGSKPPIVVINISADNLDYLGPQDRVRGRTVVKSVNTDNERSQWTQRHCGGWKISWKHLSLARLLPRIILM